MEETLKIIVLVKHVPDAQFDRHLNGEGYTTDRGESILSELDEYALEAALPIRPTAHRPSRTAWLS